MTAPRQSAPGPAVYIRALLVLAAIAFSSGTLPASAAEPAIDLAHPVAITCETSAVRLDADPFEASKGTLAIEIKLDNPSEANGPGRWKVTEVPGEHKASFIGGTRESCAPDCPMTQGKDGTLHLWSPKPLALTQLDDTTALVLATISTASLELKASLFSKKELAGLERGDCKIADSGVNSPETPVGTTPPADAEPSPPDTPASTDPAKAAEPAEPATPPPATDKKE